MQSRNSNNLHASLRRVEALPAVVQQMGDSAITALASHFGQLLADCDDAYFSLAERASSNSEQSVYFESLRTLRLQKDQILAHFHAELISCFVALTGASEADASEASKIAATGHNTEALRLVQAPEMEKNVALGNIVSKARNQASEQLYCLNKRLDFLFDQTDVDEKTNPLDPAQLSQAFTAAIEPVDLDSKARIVLFKQFERMLAAELPEICATANQQLIDAGVLPTIARSIRNVQTARPPGQAAATTPAVDFDQISRLFDNLRAYPLPQGLDVPAFFSSGSGQPIAGQQLLSLVSKLQADVNEPLFTPVDIRKLLKDSLSQQQQQGEDVCLTPPDEDVINLVAMFFDFVLEDRQLSAQAQALIGRLQFPVLKIALQDKTFFSNSTHPARQLINELVDASVGMNASEAETSDALYEKMCASIHTITRNKEAIADSFGLALAEIKEYRAIEERKAAKIETRTCDSAQAEAATRLARNAVRDLIFERLQRAEVPELLHEFLVNDWQQVLFLTRLKYGERSAEEVEAEQIMDDLIWSSAQHTDQKSQQRLRRLLPDLQARLSKWLAQVALSKDSMEQALQPLLDLHAQLLQPHASATISRSKLAADQLKALQPSGEHKSWSEMSALERQQVEYKDLAYGFIKQAENYPLGTWFDIKKPDTTLRCKLAARLTSNDSYVFVNRLGFKVLELKRKSFAYDLQQQLVQAIQTEPFFERTLGKVVSQLQQLAETVTHAAQHSQA